MYPSEQLLKIKEQLLQDIIDKKRDAQDVAKIFGVSRQAVSQWLGKLKHGGIAELIPKKSGPKGGST